MSHKSDVTEIFSINRIQASLKMWSEIANDLMLMTNITECRTNEMFEWKRLELKIIGK